MEQIVRDTVNGVNVLHLNGQFVGGEHTDKLKSTLKGLSEAEINHVILDFEGVTYLNSTAIGVLIASHASFVKKGGKIVLCNVNKSIENIFVITKLTLVFTIKNNIDEALKSL